MNRPPNHHFRTAIAVAPLVVLPLTIGLLAYPLRPWQFMTLMAAGVFIACKWITFALADRSHSSTRRNLGYLLLWPGLDANSFLDRNRTPREAGNAMHGGIKMMLGILLVILAAGQINRHPLLLGWVGMVGAILILHFGVFDLLSRGWRRARVDAQPLMRQPIQAVTVGEFWGQRWNTAFRDITHRFLFKPLISRIGVRWAIVVGFLVSGLVHELVISVPARGAYGLPTIYFLWQGVAMLLERTHPMRRLRGRLWTVIAVAAPAPVLIFPPVFVTEVFAPMLNDLRMLVTGS